MARCESVITSDISRALDSDIFSINDESNKKELEDF